MSKNTVHTIIGILLVFIPFSGFPASWKTIFYVTAGIVIVIIGFLTHLHKRSYRVAEEFTENRRP